MLEMLMMRMASGSTMLDDEVKLVADVLENSYFGGAVAISGDGLTALIGAWAGGTGSAYVYIRNGAVWTQQARLVANDAAADDRFGIAVSLSTDGNTALIGSNLDDDKGTSSGSAYVFTRSGSSWSQQAKIVPSDGYTSDNFGFSVSISGDGATAIISAHLDDDRGSNSGSVYIYVKNGSNWGQQAKISPTDGAATDYFGYKTSISQNGNTAIVGAYRGDAKGTDSGSAYVYVRNGTVWTQQAKLVPSDGAANDWFGYSVAVSGDGDTAIVGSYQDDDKGTDSGSAYVYVRNGTVWSQQAKLLASDGATGDLLGSSVSINRDGTVAIVGSIGDYVRGVSGGSAFIFVRNGAVWSEQTKLIPSDVAAADQFGFACSIDDSGKTALVGSRLNDTVALNGGCAYVFHL